VRPDYDEIRLDLRGKLADRLPGHADRALGASENLGRDPRRAVAQVSLRVVLKDFEQRPVGRLPEVLRDVGRKADGTGEHQTCALRAGDSDGGREDSGGARRAI
jgi:hypothetical protein